MANNSSRKSSFLKGSCRLEDLAPFRYFQSRIGHAVIPSDINRVSFVQIFGKAMDFSVANNPESPFFSWCKLSQLLH